MFLVNSKRIIRTGVKNFWRNSFISLASVLVITVTLFVIGSLIFLNALLDYTLSELKSRVDINIYFQPVALEENILTIKSALEDLPEVSQVVYVSRDEAIAEFEERHKDDYTTLQVLEELNENPLGSRLNVIAKDPSQYETVARFLETNSTPPENWGDVIEKVNYRQNQEVIEKLNKIIVGTERTGFAVAGALIIISLLITFNTIRLAIYMSREEISVMRLVGASNSYIRGPFVVAGILYGAISACIAMSLFYPTTLWLGNTSTQFFGGINLFEYYIQNFFRIFLIILGIGILLGATSSYYAVRKYLRV